MSIKSNWKKCKLINETISIGDGIHGTPTYDANSDVFFINGNNLLKGHICLKKDTKRVSSAQATIHQDILGEQTILISINGTLGNVAYYCNEPVVLGKSACYVNINSQNDKRFFYYLFSSPMFQQYLHYEATGTTIKNVSLRSIRNFEFLLPTLEEQRRIAQILGALDDKIELLQKQNKTLEDMAKAIFKSWFVDFDVVHAKQKGIPKADIMREYHLTDELYDLFPSDFENSSLGPIPSGWQVKPLSKIATFLNGLALQKYPTRAEEDFLPVIKIAELRNGISSSTDKANTDLPAEYIVLNGDILFSWSGSLMVKIWSGGKGALNQHLFKVFSNDYPKWFYYLWVNHYLPMFQEIAADKATTMGHIQRKHLDQALVVGPTDLKPFTQYFDTLINKQILNNKQIQTLTELRDALLPRLISGKIRV